MTRRSSLLHIFLLGAVALGLAAEGRAAEFAIARIYIEYNSTPNDLGFHVSLDGEDWKSLKIVNPKGKTLFEVAGKVGFKDLGMTELFFEGAEPALDEFPLQDLLALFRRGTTGSSARRSTANAWRACRGSRTQCLMDRWSPQRWMTTRSSSSGIA